MCFARGRGLPTARMMDLRESPWTFYRFHPSKKPDCLNRLFSSTEQPSPGVHQYRFGDGHESRLHRELLLKKHGRIFVQSPAQWNDQGMFYRRREARPDKESAL